MTRKDDARGPRMALHDLVQQLGAIHAGHAHVGHHHVRGMLRHQLHRVRPAAGKNHLPFPAHPVERPLQPLQDQRLVIHKEDPLHIRMDPAGGGWGIWDRDFKRQTPGGGSTKPAECLLAGEPLTTWRGLNLPPIADGQTDFMR